MQLFWFILKNFRVNVFITVITGIVSGVGSALLITFINRVLFTSELSNARMAWQFIGICLVVLFTGVFSKTVLVKFNENVAVDLRMQLSRNVLSAPLRYLEELGPAKVLAVLTQDINQITMALIQLPVLFINLAIIVSCLIYLGILSWKLLLVALGFMGVGILVNRLLVRKALKYMKLCRDEVDKLYDNLRSLTGGIKELKLHDGRAQDFLHGTLEVNSNALRDLSVSGMTYHNFASNWTQLLFFLFVGLLLFGMRNIQQFDNAILTGYTLTILYMMGFLGGVLNAIPALSRANISLQKVLSLGGSLAAQAKEKETTSILANPGPRWHSLELAGVTHSYHRERENSSFVLGPVDLSLSPGEMVFLIGGNGSGKTTLAKLLTGLYTPESGEILLDGQPVTDENRRLYRQQFSMIFSDFFLFDSLLGLCSPDLDEKAREYLIKFHLDHKVEIKGGVLSTTNLSQGQRKRLALLTAYLENRPIYIFDEWAADQDPVFKEVFYLELLPELKARNKTLLVISHDDRYYHVADRIIKLDQGSIVPYQVIPESRSYLEMEMPKAGSSL